MKPTSPVRAFPFKWNRTRFHLNGNRSSGNALLARMLPTITDDALWQKEYEQFVGAVSFGVDAERITFDRAVKACDGLVCDIQKGWAETS